ncbi:hypothetical protein [Schlesneria paludicola]|uniref:hypothetical protein n=1 Tax=Schlesneria paludicola TaxID=360056 RepID=UPI00029AC444|nr:hypothetical protein [Schlesneria paludicola]
MDDDIQRGEQSDFDLPQATNDASPEILPDPEPDTRLYVPDNEDWNVLIKRDSERIYCYAKEPGQDWFHLILGGEIYLTRQHERYCLRCALRLNFVTQDRLFWQHRVPKKKPTNL